MHAPDEEKELEGQEETHFPAEASWLLAQVRQNVDDPAHVPQDESHLVQVVLSFGSKKVPEGQLSTQVPLFRTKPGRHDEHCTWSMVLAMENDEMPQAVHFSGHASHSFLLLSAMNPFPLVRPV